MEYGLFNLAMRRAPSTTPAEIISKTLDEVRLAEELGFAVAWFAEHHFANLSLSPSPLLLAAHVAGATERIGVGSGVVVLPLYQPMRLLEEIAYVDILSGGRLHLGIGAGSQNHEFRGFGTDVAESGTRFLEVLDIVDMGLEEGRVAYDGRHFQIPETALSLTPRPRAKPPIYLAGMANDPEITRRVAERGYIPFASAQWLPVPKVAEKREGYVRGYEAAGRDPAAMPFAVQRLIYVTDDKADALDAAEHARYTHRIVASAKSGTPVLDRSFIREAAVMGEDEPETIADVAMIGDAEKIAQMIVEDVRGLSLSHMSCFMAFGGLEGARVRRSMELFATQVMPAVDKALAGTAPELSRQIN
jgi:alkanesulfonate monooxygenase SsuD/methylene tetrahydromethanopterin reductase-like flavin-dependent oxidoreductase (luciferase family)